MIVPTEFSTEVVNAGSDHAYSARGLRGGGGVLAVWSWAGENPTGPAFAVLGLSSFVYLLGSALSGLGWIWAPISVAVLLFGVVLSYLGIRPSLASTMWAGLAEVAVLIVIVVIDLVEGALWLLTISGICIIAVPMVANTALGVSMWRAGRFRWLHGLAPSAATVLGGVVVFSSVSPCGPHRLGGAGGAGLAPGRPRRDLLVRPTPPRPAAAGAEAGAGGRPPSPAWVEGPGGTSDPVVAGARGNRPGGPGVLRLRAGLGLDQPRLPEPPEHDPRAHLELGRQAQHGLGRDPGRDPRPQCLATDQQAGGEGAGPSLVGVGPGPRQLPLQVGPIAVEVVGEQVGGCEPGAGGQPPGVEQGQPVAEVDALRPPRAQRAGDDHQPQGLAGRLQVGHGGVGADARPQPGPLRVGLDGIEPGGHSPALDRLARWTRRPTTGHILSTAHRSGNEDLDRRARSRSELTPRRPEAPP